MKTVKQSVNMQTSNAEQSYLIRSHWCVENLSYVEGKEEKKDRAYTLVTLQSFRVKEGSVSDYGIIETKVKRFAGTSCRLR